MTREDAIKILELGTRQEALSPYLDRPMEKMLDAMIEASRMGASALRVQLAKLDWSRWEGCYTCNNIPGIMLGEITLCIGKRIITTKEHDFKFCPECGRPLIEESWAELERRIGGNNGTTDNAE